jgi:hypothetical protein
MHNMKISEDEYMKRLKKYLEEQGPNPATTFFGSWGWHATKTNEFNAMLKEDGITVKDEEDAN